MVHGQLMDFDFAHEIGFIDELVDPDQVKSRTLDWLKKSHSTASIGNE